jgi:hypothetical protein
MKSQKVIRSPGLYQATESVEPRRPPRHRRGTEPLGGAWRAESQQGVEAKEGCPTPIGPGRGDEPTSPQAAGESS